MRRLFTVVVLVLALSAPSPAWDGGLISNWGWVNDLWDYFSPTPKRPERASPIGQNATVTGGYKQAIEAYEMRAKANSTSAR